MYWSLFIARRIARGDKGSFSRFIISIAATAVALSVAVMIVASSLFTGFDNTIKDKLFAFWGHIHIVPYAQSDLFGDSALSVKQDFYPHTTVQNVRSINIYATKEGIITTRSTIEGIVLKGYGSDADTNILHPFIEEGRCVNTTAPNDPHEILLSRITVNRLQIHLHDTLTIFFINHNSRIARRLHLVGIYSTGLQEFDKKFAVTDIRLIRKLYGWDSTRTAGFEVRVNDADDMLQTSADLNAILPPTLTARTLHDIYPNIFEWLNLNATNEQIVIILMAIVAIVNMITVLLILIIERSRFIGIMKVLGSTEGSLRRVFMWNALWIIGVGLLWGNIAGIGLCWLQRTFHIIHLNPETYYVAYAPIAFNIPVLIIINICTLAICILSLLLPLLLVRRITPARAVRWQ